MTASLGFGPGRKVPGLRVFCKEFHTGIGRFWVASTQEGLVRLLLPTESEERFWGWIYRVFGPEAVVRGSSQWNNLAELEIRDYLGLGLRDFSLALSLYGTAFEVAVWEKLREIPYGRTASYAQIAAAIGRPRAARAVGAANAANPLPIIIPCHRVIGSSGELVGYGGGLELKSYLLRLEGAL